MLALSPSTMNYCVRALRSCDSAARSFDADRLGSAEGTISSLPPVCCCRLSLAFLSRLMWRMLLRLVDCKMTDCCRVGKKPWVPKSVKAAAPWDLAFCSACEDGAFVRGFSFASELWKFKPMSGSYCWDCTSGSRCRRFSFEFLD